MKSSEVYNTSLYNKYKNIPILNRGKNIIRNSGHPPKKKKNTSRYSTIYIIYEYNIY